MAKPIKVNFVRKSFQGAYVFSAWLYCREVGEYYKEVQIFADNKREARQMARQLLAELATAPA